MANVEDIRKAAISAGGPEWGLLADAALDTEFHNLLPRQERQLVTQLSANSGQITSYIDYYANILSKYIAWKVYKESNLKSLKKKIDTLSGQVDDSAQELQSIRDTAKYIGGATVLVEYSKSFETASDAHQKRADEQLKYYLVSLVGFALLVCMVFFLSIADFSFLQNLVAADIKTLPFSAGLFALKAFLLVFAYQITMFFRKNYGAEKHLQETYKHRSDVLQSLHAVYNAITDTSEKDKILSTGVLFAYERGETGYITTKEGAGAGDGLIESILARGFK